MRPFALLALAACSSAPLATPVSPPPDLASDAAIVARATQLHLEGRSGEAATLLEPRSARLDPSGLALLGRAQLASGAAAGRRTLEMAIEHAEKRGALREWWWGTTDEGTFDRVSFAGNGLVFASGNGPIAVWDVVEQRRVARHANFTRDAASPSPDGTRFLQLWGSETAVRDAVTGEILAMLPCFPVAWTPEGHILAHKDRVPVEIDDKGTELARFGGEARDVALAGSYVVADHGNPPSGGDRKLTVWDRAARTVAFEVQLPGEPWFFGAGTNGELLVGMYAQAGAPKKGTVYALDPRTRARRELIKGTSTRELERAAVSPDGKRLVVSTSDGVALVVDVASGRTLRELATGGGALGIHPINTVALAAGTDGFALWNLETGARTARFNRRNRAMSVAFDAKGDRLAFASTSGVVTSWDLATNKLWSVTPRAGAPATRVAFAPDGTLAASSSLRERTYRDRSADLVTVWSRDGQPVWSQNVDGVGWLGFDPRTSALATQQFLHPPGDDETGVQLWTSTGARDRVIATGAVSPLGWSSGALVYGAGDKLAVRVSPGTTVELDVVATEAAASPDGTLVAVSEAGGRVSIWDVRTREPLAVGYDDGGGARAIAWSPDGGMFATAAADVRLWDTKGTLLATLPEGSIPTSVAFHPSGRYLAVACEDGSVDLWSVATAKMLASLAVPEANRGIAFTNEVVDGELALSDTLHWSIGGTVVVHGLGAWQRIKKPGFVADRLAALPPDTRPREAPAPIPSPSSCFTPSDKGEAMLVSTGPATNVLPLCVVAGSHGATLLPQCFSLDLATGVYRPRIPTPREALLRHAADPRVATIERDGTKVSVCRAGACTTFLLPELAELSEVELSVGPDGKAFAVHGDGKSGHTASVYDAATGKRTAQFGLAPLFGTSYGGHFSVRVLGPSLQISSKPCAGPCVQSILVTLAGKRFAWVGGVAPGDGDGLTGTPVRGDIWVFEDGSSRLTYQDVRTGRVVGHAERATDCTGGAREGCPVELVRTDFGTAVVQAQQGAGDVTVIDERGVTVGRHRLPVCK